MNTGTCLRPSWTAIVWPTISGKTVEARDHVRIICFEPEAFIDSIRRNSRSSTNGPFFDDLLTCATSFPTSTSEARYKLMHAEHAVHFQRSLPRRRRLTMNLSDSLCLRRVGLPSVGTPHGVTGWRPPLDLPSPPPCGWSTGFMADPRTDGRLPRQRLRPALPPEMFSWSTFPTWPTVARHASGTRRTSPEARRRTPYPSSFATS